ncbi:MAG: NAD(P)-binding protein, partial [Pseudomonadota bacterium]
MKRRAFLGAASALALAGCDAPPPAIAGGFTGIDVARGHALRDGAWRTSAPVAVRRTRVVIAGGGVAGLAAARALRLGGIDDFALMELEGVAGGNSRGGMVGGIACPLGAHYLPVPGDDAHEVQDLLEELGLRQRVAGRWEYDERNLCHSPQERLFFQGEWHDGLLP